MTHLSTHKNKDLYRNIFEKTQCFDRTPEYFKGERTDTLKIDQRNLTDFVKPHISFSYSGFLATLSFFKP